MLHGQQDPLHGSSSICGNFRLQVLDQTYQPIKLAFVPHPPNVYNNINAPVTNSICGQLNWNASSPVDKG